MKDFLDYFKNNNFEIKNILNTDLKNGAEFVLHKCKKIFE